MIKGNLNRLSSIPQNDRHFYITHPDGFRQPQLETNLPRRLHVPCSILFTTQEGSHLYDGRTSTTLMPVPVTWTEQAGNNTLRLLLAADLDFCNRTLLSQCNIFPILLTRGTYYVIPVLALTYDIGPIGVYPAPSCQTS